MKMQDLPVEKPNMDALYANQLHERRNKDLLTKRVVAANTENDNEDSAVDSEDLTEAKINPPSTPSFPLFIFSLAIIKDVMDFAELTIIGIVIKWVVAILFVIVVFLWCLGKAGFIKKLIIKRLVLIAAIGLLPFVGLIPEASLFILWMHYREIKYIGQILQTLEKLEGAK